jgi:hypothetical protein
MRPNDSDLKKVSYISCLELCLELAVAFTTPCCTVDVGMSVLDWGIDSEMGITSALMEAGLNRALVFPSPAQMLVPLQSTDGADETELDDSDTPVGDLRNALPLALAAADEVIDRKGEGGGG